MKSLVCIVFINIIIAGTSIAQQSGEITLQYCYDRIETDYPTSKKIELQEKITALNTEIKQSGLYPEVLVSGSASYQSEVTNVSFGGPTAPSFSKDHYKVSIDVSQSIFDGGRTKGLKELEQKNGQVQQAGVKVELWNIRNQIDQVYFGILLMNKQRATIELLIKDLNEQLSLISSKVKNGILLPSNELILKAEILKARQQLAQVNSNIVSGYEVLGEIIGESVLSDTELVIPSQSNFETLMKAEASRPELEVFARKEKVLDAQIGITDSEKLPTVSAFAKTSYGRPGFDAFDDDLHFYWMVGLKAQWSFRNWRNSEKKTAVIQIQKDQNEADEDAFERQLLSSLHDVEQNISAIKEQIELDEELVELRKEVVKEKSSQLKQGVITSTDYVTELNALSRAQLNFEIHKVQLIQAKNEYLTKRGISWK